MGPRYGVFAPAASGRELVVPEEEHGEDGASEEARGEGDGATATTRRSRYSWAELMKRVFETDVLRCPACGGVRKVLASVMEAAAVRRVLAHLGKPLEAPVVAPARGP
ncbi:MAG: hypothetical protein AAF628_37570, partial [Planctomycetota bacterium]